jgi:hypothetical protein
MVAACLGTAVVHAMFLSTRLGNDEGGFLAVAQHWGEPGQYLYGPLWVDRPPGLIAVFALAAHLGPYGVRLVALAIAVLLVAAAGWAAGAVRQRAAGWAAWTAFAFVCSPLISAQQLNGELVASAAVMTSVAATMHALFDAHRSRHSAALGLLAGALATAAVLTKQNFVDALVFSAVLLAGTAVTSRRRRADAVKVAGWLTLGASATVGTVLWWAIPQHRLGALLYALYGFRADAAAVMASWSLRAPLRRLDNLAVAGVLCGLLVVLAVAFAANAGRLRRPDPLSLAIATATVSALAGIAAGGNFWTHYLIALVPMTSLATAFTVTAPRTSPCGTARSLWPQGQTILSALVVGTIALTTGSAVVAAHHDAQAPSAVETTARWLADSSRPGDTSTVAYTHANVLAASGLAPAYPYAWSLPLRTLDPNLDLLSGRLGAPEGPTWFLQWDQEHAWGLDANGNLDAALKERYHVAAIVCGHQVWLRDAAERVLARVPRPALCGP